MIKKRQFSRKKLFRLERSSKLIGHKSAWSSFGVGSIEVELEHDGATSTGILRAVDAALYRAKHEGRGRVVVAG